MYGRADKDNNITRRQKRNVEYGNKTNLKVDNPIDTTTGNHTINGLLIYTNNYS